MSTHPTNNPKDESYTTSPLRAVQLTGLFGDRDVSIEVAPGPITLLYGQNGAGKSTALRVIEKLLGSSMLSLAQEPISGAELTFQDEVRLAYTSGSPGKWTEIWPDGRIVGGAVDEESDELPELSDAANNDPGFRRYIETVTPFHVLRGVIVGRSGRPVAESVARSLYDSYLSMQARQRRTRPKSNTERRTVRRDCFLIGSDRLESHESRPATRDGRSSSPIGWGELRPPRIDRFLGIQIDEDEADVVVGIADDIRNRIRDARQEFSRLSWQLDGSFIRRALAQVHGGDPLTTDERGTLVRQVSELQGRMVNCALAASSAEIPASSSDSTDVRKILDLYLKDLKQKAETSLTVLPKLELFEEILNSHFTDKSTRFSLERGMSVSRRGSDSGIPLDRLSSGERHLIVLFHRLIFKTKPGGLCLIDEPEISLHVDWQERFIDSVAKVATVSPQQFLIATHSPSIVGKHYELMRDVRGDSRA